ncbi:MAG: lipid-A-disaccharide synthase, partial [Candidatus Omnitrophica bacterium CG11_big_fil_rev_8_21_14_0_20_42_13]
MKRILIIAGEASSDMHAANLIKEISALDKDISFFGLGGGNMQKAGVNLHNNIVRLAFIGPGGLFKHYLKLRKIYNNLCVYIEKNRPDCAILIDYAEFNLRIAKKLKALNVPIIYYISPQVWAWGLWRIKTIRRLVDKMLVFFRFEETLYKNHSVDVDFIGHPLLDTVKVDSDKEDIIVKFGINKDSKIVGILPGSREGEIKNILPIMLESAKLLVSKKPALKIDLLLPLAATADKNFVEYQVEKSGLHVKIIQNDTYDAIAVCDCAMVASGTATLETALLEVPMAIIYKANFLTYILTKNLIKLPYIGLVNIVAGRRLIPEFLQYEAMPDK